MDRTGYVYRITLEGSAVNFGLVIFKLVAGILGHSSALLADAIHSLSDFISDLVILVCVRLAKKPEDADHAYGHGKYETLASVAVGLMLLAAGLGLFWEGFSTIIAWSNGAGLAAPTWLAFAAALIAILVKEALYHYTIRAARKIDSAALRANAWHHRSDAISSLATIIGVGCAMLPGKYWLVMDPLAACLISLFIVAMAFSLMKPGIDELMEKSLPDNEMRAVEQILATTAGVCGYHRLRTRRMGANRAVEAHIKLNGSMSLNEAHDIASLVEQRIRLELGENTHVGIHMEPAAQERKN